MAKARKRNTPQPAAAQPDLPLIDAAEHIKRLRGSWHLATTELLIKLKAGDLCALDRHVVHHRDGDRIEDIMLTPDFWQPMTIHFSTIDKTIIVRTKGVGVSLAAFGHNFFLDRADVDRIWRDAAAP